MSLEECSTEYKKAMDKIRAYPQGFCFRIDWTELTTSERKAFKILIDEAIGNSYLESVSAEYDHDMNLVTEIYKRTDAPDRI